MSELVDDLRELFKNEEVRYAYAESALNTFVASQLKVLREQREMSQGQLAETAGTRQSGISRLENVNYSSWKVETLRRLARALGVRLKISFEEFGTLIPEIQNFQKENLRRARFADDPVFSGCTVRGPKLEATFASASEQFARFPVAAQAINLGAVQLSGTTMAGDLIVKQPRKGTRAPLTGSYMRVSSPRPTRTVKRKLSASELAIPASSYVSMNGIKGAA